MLLMKVVFIEIRRDSSYLLNVELFFCVSVLKDASMGHQIFSSSSHFFFMKILMGVVRSCLYLKYIRQ